MQFVLNSIATEVARKASESVMNAQKGGMEQTKNTYESMASSLDSQAASLEAQAAAQDVIASSAMKTEYYYDSDGDSHSRQVPDTAARAAAAANAAALRAQAGAKRSQAASLRGAAGNLGAAIGVIVVQIAETNRQVAQLQADIQAADHLYNQKMEATKAATDNYISKMKDIFDSFNDTFPLTSGDVDTLHNINGKQVSTAQLVAQKNAGLAAGMTSGAAINIAKSIVNSLGSNTKMPYNGMSTAGIENAIKNVLLTSGQIIPNNIGGGYRTNKPLKLDTTGLSALQNLGLSASDSISLALSQAVLTNPNMSVKSKTETIKNLLGLNSASLVGTMAASPEMVSVLQALLAVAGGYVAAAAPYVALGAVGVAGNWGLAGLYEWDGGIKFKDDVTTADMIIGALLPPVAGAWRGIKDYVNQAKSKEPKEPKKVGKNDKLPNQGEVDGGVEGAPPVDAGDQGKHVPGHNNAKDPRKSKWPEGKNGVSETQEGWLKGEELADGTRVWDSGEVIGANGETGVRVHVDDDGIIHGYPVNPGQYLK